MAAASSSLPLSSTSRLIGERSHYQFWRGGGESSLAPLSFKLMRVKTFYTLVGLALWWALPAIVCAQAFPDSTSTDRMTGDTNNAVIEGRVALPSGFAAERNVKITVRNSVSVLYRIYTNKHGEFRFHDLSEGIYYVQAEIEGANFE